VSQQYRYHKSDPNDYKQFVEEYVKPADPADTSETEDLLDEIDELIEEIGEDFATHYRQKGGQ
jgi:ubiquitin-like protein Pup